MANDLSYPEEVLDEMLAVLSDNEWDEPVEKLRPIRNNLCTQLGITPPVMKKSLTSADNQNKLELQSDASLVDQ
ncbi:hypothetical protein EB796_001771 [Bugula neritina]|uniref:Uncharacterized protein n=1 Tax=Bugula neritina TaxID=10212 RepID=A0A7J7KP07_BUGNE|nr:hypothetical protein EB796_001771 [Bugula neritina]